MEEFRFNIVVVHRNGIDKIDAFLKSALACIDSHQDKITVVDNHSNDESIKFITNHYTEISLIQNQFNFGYAHACNQGIKAHHSKYTLICNNDLTLTQEVLKKIEAGFNHLPKAAIISPILKNSDGTTATSGGFLPDFYSELGIRKKPKLISSITRFQEIETCIGACMALRTCALNDFGYLDNSFYFYYEETEWHYRVNATSWKIYLDLDNAIQHIGGASSKKFYWRTRIEYFRSRLLFWNKCFTKKQARILLIYHSIKSCFDLAYYLTLNVLTLGTQSKLKNKLIDRIVILAWLIANKPNTWGLPDKPNITELIAFD